jgi:hypothetical protein
VLPTDPIIQFAAQHLGGRSVPDDLRKLLESQWQDVASGSSNRLKNAGVEFIDGDRLPRLIAAECAGRDDLEGAMRLACAQAMGDMLRYSGFVAEDTAGDAIGYWFGPDRIPIGLAPLMCFDTNSNFSILCGNGIAEAILVIASHGDNQTFSQLRVYFSKLGISIAPPTIQEVQRRECAFLPQATYEQLIQTYLGDLSTTSRSGIGGPVNIMTIHRGSSRAPNS